MLTPKQLRNPVWARDALGAWHIFRAGDGGAHGALCGQAVLPFGAVKWSTDGHFLQIVQCDACLELREKLLGGQVFGPEEPT